MIQNFWDKSPVKIFENEKFGKVRTVDYNNEIWFVAKDVCDVLDIQNTTQALQNLDSDERAMFNIGRQGDANIVNEYGLYSLIFGSRKKEAMEFKRWLTHEVIPSIRKTGSYSLEGKLTKIATDKYKPVAQVRREIKDEINSLMRKLEQSYSEPEDSVKLFLDEECVFGEGQEVAEFYLHGKYLKWCSKHDINKPCFLGGFSRRILQYTGIKMNKYHVLQGMGWRDNE